MASHDRILSLILISVFLSSAYSFICSPSISQCRFSPHFSQNDVLNNPQEFACEVFYREGRFHQDGVGFNAANGMTYGSSYLDTTTGLVKARNCCSTAGKESLQIMVYAHAIRGDPGAAQFVYPQNVEDAPLIAAAYLSLKLKTYLKFNETYPGFGGFLPGFLADGTDIEPTPDWANRLSALDNGELIWAVYAAVHALSQSNRPEFQDLGHRWQTWLDYTKVTAARVFYNGAGRVCAIASIANQSLLPTHPSQSYACEGTQFLNDPYQGELFTWWLYFFGNFPSTDRSALWTTKRPLLVSTRYIGSVVNSSASDHRMIDYSNYPILPPAIPPITLPQGSWFSSSEQWKLLMLPYLSIPLLQRIYKNAERARTCNSVLMSNPGMFASVNNITNPSSGGVYGFISAAGIPSIANQMTQELDVITPYSVFPTLLFNQSIGLAWYKNMLDAPGMQNPYGSTESLRRDGTGISSLVSWDSKVPTVVALLGGVSGFVRQKMEADGIYVDFVRVTAREYQRVFNPTLILGEQIDLCLPQVAVPKTGLVNDYEMCR